MPLDAPRNVAEVLRKSLDALDVDDVREIVQESAGETLFVEWKALAKPDLVAKSCAAFANTLGGLLIVGVDDATRDLVGVEPPSGEVELWVKNVLRDHVLPLPPFRARQVALPHTPDRVLLLVLVEESSTTPHLLTRSGAVYVRKPGSSDPIKDYALLLDLTRRGREARSAAFVRAPSVVSAYRLNDYPLFTLALVPTGVKSDVVAELYSVANLDPLRQAITIFEDRASARERFEETWLQHEVRIARDVMQDAVFDPEGLAESLVVHSDGSLQIQRSLMARDARRGPEPHGPLPMRLPEAPDPLSITGWLRIAIGNALNLIASVGGHGDVCYSLRVSSSGRHVFYAAGQAVTRSGDFELVGWLPLSPTADQILGEVADIQRAMLRFLGVAPG